MKKTEIIERINSIPAEKLNAAAHAIISSNPVNAITANRANYTRIGGTITDICFMSRATKENMMNVYHAILDEITIHDGIEAAHEIDPEYTPEWYAAEEAATAEAPEAEEPEVIEAEPEETEQERTDRENREHCKRIAEELEQYTDGNVYRCTECGELCTIEEAEDEDGFTVYKTSCGCTLDYEPDQMSAYDFIADALDIEVSCSLEREYRSARIMLAYGGPNIYIDTARRAVELYWWTDRAEYPISSSAADALDEAIEELWGCR